MGRNTDALLPMQKAVTLMPNDAESHNILGNILQTLGLADQSAACYRNVIDIKPDDAYAHCNLGVILRQQGCLNEAESSYRRALLIHPSFAEAHNNLGNTLKDLGRLDEAAISYRQALSLKPEYAAAHNNLGATLKELGKPDDSAESFRRALEINPEYAEAHNNLSTALKELGQFHEALTTCRRALQINPNYADAHSNLGGIQKELGQIDEAEASCHRALLIKPDLAVAHNNLANALQTRGNSEAAIASYNQALALKPGDTMARYNLGYAQLACGQLTEGWQNYAFRICIDKNKFPFIEPWAGEDLVGKSILISGEQGIGDEIMFASLFSEIIARAGCCIIECAPKLVPLFTRSFSGAQVIPKTEPPHPVTYSGIDYQSDSGSLAQWLRPTLTSFPQRNNFLKSDPARVAYWKTRISDLGNGPKIGINWRSGLQTGERSLHYTSLNQWKPIFSPPAVHFINLQYDECSSELNEVREKFGIPVHNFNEVDMYNDLDETAALIQALDLVICAPTAVSSIAAAMGINTWIMSYGTPWTCHGTEHDCWFPSVRYFKREWNQNWDEIIEHVASQLNSLTSN
jgi:Tfp pilus assembly protein PilF